MIAFIEGTVVEKNPENLILNHNGMGFDLQYDAQYAGRLPAVGESGRIYTYMHVREDAVSLYAFPQHEDKQLFELLLSVSGIGPKSAGAIAAGLSPGHFALAILNGDVKTLSSIKGVGKKSAERLILELKDKLKKQNDFISSDEAELAGQMPGHEGEGSTAQEAEAALCVLGYSRREAVSAIRKVLGKSSVEPELSELIRLALRELAVI